MEINTMVIGNLRVIMGSGVRRIAMAINTREIGVREKFMEMGN